MRSRSEPKSRRAQLGFLNTVLNGVFGVGIRVKGRTNGKTEVYEVSGVKGFRYDKDANRFVPDI